MSQRQSVVRRGLALLMAGVGIAISATPALGLLLWTLTGSPLTAPSGAATTFTLTATNLDLLAELGCLEVDLPPSFSILGASAGTASNGDHWEAVIFPNKVAVHSLSGGGRLQLGQSITFTITAVPTQPGTWTWPNHAHAREDCGGAEELGVPLTIVVPVPTPTPTPTPVPTPTPPPTPAPTPVLPIEPLPSLLPILPPPPPIGLPTPPATGTPSSPIASPTSSPSGSSSPAPTSSPSPTQVVAALPAEGAGGSFLEVGELAGFGESGGPVAAVSLGPLGMIDGITIWAIPSAIVGGPGLLVILWVLAQTGVAVAWIPAVRRMRGRDSGDPGPFSGPRRTVAS